MNDIIEAYKNKEPLNTPFEPDLTKDPGFIEWSKKQDAESLKSQLKEIIENGVNDE